MKSSLLPFVRYAAKAAKPGPVVESAVKREPPSAAESTSENSVGPGQGVEGPDGARHTSYTTDDVKAPTPKSGKLSYSW
jgi:hypothetical protein